MSRAVWILLLVACGVGAAVVIGLLANGGDSQARARQSFCSSLDTLQSSVGSLIGLSPTSASKEDYENALDQVEDDWDAVSDDASDLAGATTEQLEDAWDSFESALDAVPDDASVSDALGAVASAGKTLASSVASTLSGPDCS